MNPKPHQTVFFSYLKYGVLTAGNEVAKKTTTTDKNTSILLITGIANPSPLLNELKQHYKYIQHVTFRDHHEFTNKDITYIKEQYKQLPNNKIVVTTEKDFMRLSSPEIESRLNNIPLYYIPIEVDFHGDDKKNFDSQILNYVRENSGS